MISYFFDANVIGVKPDGRPIYDREYHQADHANYYKSIFTNGLFVKRDLSACKVTASGGSGGAPWTLTVATGRVFVDGYQGITDGKDEFATSLLPNGFYRVIIRLDTSEAVREFSCSLVFGSATDYPSLVREGNIYDLCLADVTITDGVPTITDTRYDDDLCGQVEFAANPMQPPYYPPTDLPQDLWTYSLFPETMTPEQIAQFESNPSLMDMFKANRFRNIPPELAAALGLPEDDPTVDAALGSLLNATDRAYDKAVDATSVTGAFSSTGAIILGFIPRILIFSTLPPSAAAEMPAVINGVEDGTSHYFHLGGTGTSYGVRITIIQNGFDVTMKAAAAGIIQYVAFK